MSTEKTAGQRLAELRRSNAATSHDTRPRGERSRKDIKAAEIRRNSEENR